MENLRYRTDRLEKYFSRNRVRWEQFYESERVVIDRVWPGGAPAVLDIGCGCGGLGLALRERFGSGPYTGIEINAEAAATAGGLNSAARILSGDFLEMDEDLVPSGAFDVVFSLSCIDWNLAFDAMFAKAWTRVKPGGVFVASFRLTTAEGINDAAKSYQYINFDGRMDGEIAPYVVLNAADLMRRVRKLGASRLYAYGYYGAPSRTAVTPFERLCFAVLAATRPVGEAVFEAELALPDDIAAAMRAAI
jgi:SAM-dependent methyltransferase